MAPFTVVSSNDISHEDLNKIAKIKLGSTVFPGTDVIEDSNIQKYPIATNINYLVDAIKRIDILGIFFFVSTGTINVPIETISEEGISNNGIASGFEGPGVLVIENGSISVKSPENFVYGITVPYTVAVKNENGLDIVQNNKTIKTVSYSDINNNTVPHDVVPVEDLIEWYEKASVGDELAIEYALSGFNDNRSLISPNEIKTFFGDDIYEYSIKHPKGSPILVYMHNYTENISEDYYTHLGSYPQYNDANRIYNAKQFVDAWNNTLIPPHSTSSGMNIVGFTTSKDPKAPGGGASHGVCPPARALRAAVLGTGLPLPAGMNGDWEAVNFGVNPGSGIKVTNDGDYPIKIIMWTEGEGTSMIIHSKIIRYIPT